MASDALWNRIESLLGFPDTFQLDTTRHRPPLRLGIYKDSFSVFWLVLSFGTALSSTHFLPNCSGIDLECSTTDSNLSSVAHGTAPPTL